MLTTNEEADADGSGQPCTSSNSAAVDSSSSLPDPKKCSECDASLAVVFCSDCKPGVPLCEPCDEIVHKPKATRGHERMNIDSYRAELRGYLAVQRGLGSSSPTEGQTEADEKNKLCYFCPIEYRISFLWNRLEKLVSDPNAHPSVVAFIGPTGVGKSTLMRILKLSLDGVTDAGDMPLAGAVIDSQSTSGDIHMYAGGQNQSVADSPYPLLYVDCEGLYGSKAPRATTRLWEDFKKLSPGRVGKRDDFLSKRTKHVHTSYPRMLYTFSDVVCFVFSGNLREHASIMNPLLEWGRWAAAGAANHIRPRLILIFNKNDMEFAAENFDDVRLAFQEWKKGDKSNELANDGLESYYTDPVLVHIPHSKFSTAAVSSRVKILLEEIHASTLDVQRSREKMNLHFTRRQLQLYMQLAADTFTKNPTAEFDIVKASMARRPPSVGLAGYIGDFRRAVEEQVRVPESKSKSYEISLNVLQTLIKSSVLLWKCRRDEYLASGKYGQLPKDLRTALKEAQEVIDGEMPCAAVHESKHFQCYGLRKYHDGGAPHVDTKKFGGRWMGEFIPDPEAQRAADTCRLVNLAEELQGTDKLDLKVIRRELSKAREAMHEVYPETKYLTSFEVCVSCMLELPMEMLSCGHIICAKCAKEEADMHSSNLRIIDLTCPACLSPAQWYPRDLPPLAGYRILSLDGGGVRGIVELLSLQKVMSFFPGMHVEDLFDIIAGTSTGGIIALALTVHALSRKPMRLPEVIQMFQDLSTKVFSSEMRRVGAGIPYILRFFQFLRIYDTKYKSDNLLKFLEEHLGKESLVRSCVGGPHVIITSCDGDNSLLPAAWFTSYNRLSLKNKCGNLVDQVQREKNEEPTTLLSGRMEDNHRFSPKDAAAATSAASSYFQAYKAGSRTWIDGGIRFNCPAAVAIDEAKVLWPKNRVSALISLGCGALQNDKQKQHSDSLYCIVNRVVDVVTDAEAQFDIARKQLQEDWRGCCIRLNPIIKLPDGQKCELDDAAKMPILMSEMNKYLSDDHAGSAHIQKAANLLFAALFYLHADKDQYLGVVNRDTEMCIRSRAPLPQCFQAALIDAGRLRSPDPFSVTVKETVDINSKFHWNRCTWDQNVMNLPFKLDWPRFELTIEVKLHMCVPGTKIPESERSLPISGMPCSLRA